MGVDKEQLAIVAWAQALLKGTASHQAQRHKLDKRRWRLGETFALDTLERHVVELLWAAESSLAVADLARTRGGLTVERVRALFDEAVDAALSPSRAMRRHALVAVDGAELVGMPAADARLRLAPGLLARLAGRAEPSGLALGTVRMLPGARGDVPARVMALFESRAGEDAGATVWTLDGCGRREALDLARGLARLRDRGVLVVDGELVARARDADLLLACARREADCDGDIVVVVEAAALGERYLALLAPPASAPPPFLILCAEDRTRDPVNAAPFAVRRLALRGPAKAPAGAPAEAQGPANDDGLEEVRKRAIRDAERALGIFRPPPHTVEPPRTSEPPAAVAPARPPAPPSAAPPPPAAPPPAAAPPAKPDATKKRSAKGAQYFGGEYTEPQPAAPPPAAAPTPVAAPVATAPPAAAATTTGAVAADGAALPLAENATVDELARACATSPSAQQRIELMSRIRTVKSPAVIAALRANAQSAHPGVRAVAEAAMAALFGPTWNTVRPVPKPIQPPRSED